MKLLRLAVLSITTFGLAFLATAERAKADDFDDPDQCFEDVCLSQYGFCHYHVDCIPCMADIYDCAVDCGVEVGPPPPPEDVEEYCNDW